VTFQHSADAVEVCPNGWIQSVVSGKCFRIIRRKSIASEGSKLCRDFGGFAASIESEVEQDFVQKYVLNETDDWLRIGGRRNANTKKWYWEDGTPMKYTNFNADEASVQDVASIYVYVYSNKEHDGTDQWGKWHASHGSHQHDTLCQLRLFLTQPVKSGTASVSVTVPCLDKAK